MYCVTNFWLTKVLTTLIDHAITGPYSGPLDGVFLGLAQTPTPALNPNQGMAAITEANYTGYVRQAVVWHGPYTDTSLQQSVQSGALFFEATDSVHPNTITSLFVADALTGGNLLFSELLPGGSIPMPSGGSAFALALVFQMLNTTDYGDAVVIQ